MLWGSSKKQPGWAQGWREIIQQSLVTLASFWEAPTTGCASLLLDCDERHPTTSGWMFLQWYHPNLSNVLYCFVSMPLFGQRKTSQHINHICSHIGTLWKWQLVELHNPSLGCLFTAKQKRYRPRGPATSTWQWSRCQAANKECYLMIMVQVKSDKTVFLLNVCIERC